MNFEEKNENLDAVNETDNQAQQESDIDNEFLEDFFVEASEHIENIEMNVFTFEKEPDNEEVIHSMFRSFHTVKGLAGFVEQSVIENIAHKTETLLDCCRKKVLKPNKFIANIILKSSDYIKKICDDISLLKDEAFIAEINNHLQKVMEESEKTGEEQDSENMQASGQAGPAQVSAEKPAPKTQEPSSPASEEFPLSDEEEELALQAKEEQPAVPIELPENTPKLGEILVKDNKLAPEDVNGILEKQQSDYPDFKFGEVAIHEEKVKPKDVLNAVKKQQVKTPVKEEYMRISADKVDNLVDMVGELVITQSLVEQSVAAKCESSSSFTNNLGRMARITKDLQNLAMFLRMVPLKSTFQKITRIARDTINELNKDVDFSTSGDDTEIDRMVTDKLLEPLVHLVKNAIAHGIEPAKERTAAGKPATGSVRLNAYNKRGNIYIEITDDGGGINTEKVYRKALEKGLVDSAKHYTEQEVLEFILLPGFSTMEVANNIAGRGVGLDVVKTELQKNGGKIEIQSEEGKGSTFTMKIPVNHAILNGTVLDINGSNYIIPTLNVKQIIQPREDQWVYVKNTKSRIVVREEIIPFLPISVLFGTPQEKEEPNLVLIVELEQQYRALPVKNVIGRQEIVVKPVGEEFSDLRYISGMSILGDGKVSLILDVEHIFKIEGECSLKTNMEQEFTAKKYTGVL